MKTEMKLAKIFRAVASQEHTLETTASKILALVRGAKALTAPKFDKLVEAAYAAAGWNTKPGRPNGDAVKKDAVPDTVRTYVTTIRRAMRARIKVAKFSSLSALRVALDAKIERTASSGGSKVKALPALRANGHARIPEALAQNFVGVEIDQPKEPNGALFHDLAALFIKLPEEHRSMLGRQLARLHAKYLPLASAKPQRKAA